MTVTLYIPQTQTLKSNGLSESEHPSIIQPSLYLNGLQLVLDFSKDRQMLHWPPDFEFISSFITQVRTLN